MKTIHQKSILSKVETLRLYQVILLHLVVTASFYILLFNIGEIKQLPSNENLINWDAGIYFDIKNNGYAFDQGDKAGNTGFYPLFPFIWKLLNTSPLLISLFNFCIFSFSILLLSKSFKISNVNILLYLSLPSILFLYTPYAESLFFLFATLFIVGWKDKNQFLLLAGCFLAGLARPSIFYFLPSILLVMFFTMITGQLKKPQIKTYTLIIVATLISIIFSFIVYFITTGDPLAFFKMREAGNSFSWPTFPLTTWRGTKLLWLDGLAFTVCLAAITYTLNIGNRLLSKKKESLSTDNTILFSLGFIITAGIHILFFNIKDPSGSTSLLGLNRFVFASPFFLILFNYFQTKNNLKKTNTQWLIFTITLSLIAIGVFHPGNFPSHLRPAIYIIAMGAL